MSKSLDRLKVLSVLLKVRSPSLAAIELKVTQSAVSKTLAILRKELKDPLLLRRGDVMLPTPFGESLARALAGPLLELEKITDMKRGRARPHVLRVAMRDQFVSVLGPGLIKAFCKTEPKGKLDFTIYDRKTVARELEQGEIDLAVAVDPPNSPHLMTRTLYRDTFVCLTPKRKRPDLDEYLRLPQIATTAHSGYFGIDSFLSAKNMARTIVAEVPFFLAAFHLSKQEGLTLTLPKRLALQLKTDDFYIHPLPMDIPGFATQLIWDARFNSDPENTWLREQIVASAK